ncbi:hypothetical protein Acid345_4090 [Candidatus Koribacter versatilis Ellin345]|uniref:Uncharacterized protein n=1 Tax=Koribacter versatilis (strain Ellin345) TaxID=204669 RepID=Q1IJ60_KORVE|nr:hypothetical protein [Candidatus Koribacter versatilis]ABF43090.1 hypothetical protein Acid345_4090 [Candidatus Koribacter versatilis Ellin345]
MRRGIMVAVLAVLVVSSTSLAKPGKERWAIKTSVVSTGKHHSLQYDKFLALVQPEIPAGFDRDHDRIPGKAGEPSEGDIITIHGWLQLVAFEKTASGDEDYHIQISASQSDGKNCIIVEAPNPDFIDDPTLKQQATAIRAWVREKLLHDPQREPSSKGIPMTHPPYVSATGQLFFDASHEQGSDPGGGRGKLGMNAGTVWELHPLTKLTFAKAPSA